MDAPILTRAQCQAIDRLAMDDYGYCGLVLMENAGRGAVDLMERLDIVGPVVILCGKGNNAGDGYVIARHLAIRGYVPRIVSLVDPSALRGDAAVNFAIASRCGIEISIATNAGVAQLPEPSGAALSRQLDEQMAQAGWIVDALLGTGATGEPRPPFDEAIDWINAQQCKKLAIDVPSGLDCDTGAASAHTVRADHTCTFAAWKTGFTRPEAAGYTGTVHMCDIGVPPRLIEEIIRQSS